MREPSDQSLYEKITEGTGAITELAGLILGFSFVAMLIAVPFELAFCWLLNGCSVLWLIPFNLASAWVTYHWRQQIFS